MKSPDLGEAPDADVVEFLYAMSGSRYWEDTFLDGLTVEIWGPGSPGVADHWHVFVRNDRSYAGIGRLQGADWDRLHAWHAEQLESPCKTLRAAAEAAADLLAQVVQDQAT